MEIETYEVTETLSDGSQEDLQSEEYVALVEELGLEGQKTFITRRAAGDDTVTERCPYRLATREELNVFRACFPARTELSEFDLSPVPLRVLQIAAHAQRVIPQPDGATLKLVVLHPEDSTLRDPVLLAEVREGYDTKYYLLARWGEALDDFETLRGIARKKLIASVKEQLSDIQSRVREMERQIETKVDAHLLGKSVHFVYIGTPSLS